MSADVARRAPAVGVPHPLRGVAVGCAVREAVNDVAVERPKGVVHLLDVVIVERIPVVLEVVDTPFAPLLHVGLHEGVRAEVPDFGPVLPVVAALFLITVMLVVPAFFDPLVDAVGVVRVAADMRGIGPDPRRGVDAHPQAHVVNLAYKALHVGEFRVRLDRVVFAAAFALPSVVDVDVGPAVVGESAFDHRARRREHLLLRDVARPAVPAVPAHRRSERDFVAHDDLQVALAAARRICGFQVHGIFARSGYASRDPSGFGVEFQPFGKPLGRESHRTDARRGDRVEEFRTRADAEDAGAVDARGVGGFRGQDVFRHVGRALRRSLPGRRPAAECGQDEGRQVKQNRFFHRFGNFGFRVHFVFSASTGTNSDTEYSLLRLLAFTASRT